MTATTPTVRRRRASHYRRCIRCFVRAADGRTIRYLSFTDYRECESGGYPQLYLKRLGHRRYARGLQIKDESLAGWLSELPADTWVHVTVADGGTHAA